MMDLDYIDRCGGGGKWSNSGWRMKAEPTGFADGLDGGGGWDKDNVEK